MRVYYSIHTEGDNVTLVRNVYTRRDVAARRLMETYFKLAPFKTEDPAWIAAYERARLTANSLKGNPMGAHCMASEWPALKLPSGVSIHVKAWRE